jgi:hypothetical protein
MLLYGGIDSKSRHNTKRNLIKIVEHVIVLSIRVNNTTVCVDLQKTATYLMKKAKVNEKTTKISKRFTHHKCKQKYLLF